MQRIDHTPSVILGRFACYDNLLGRSFHKTKPAEHEGEGSRDMVCLE